MDTSLRYAGDTKALRIHAKEKLPIDSNTRLQLHGELDTKAGSPSYFCAIFRHFYPELTASLGVGLQYNKREKLGYVIRAKKAFPVTNKGSVNFVVKGRCDADQEFKKKNYKGAAEFSWAIMNFQEDQDVRLKLGYEMFEKVPYMQIRDSNWTLSADIKGGWKVRFDL